jgi:phospholipase/carboxylesterase
MTDEAQPKRATALALLPPKGQPELLFLLLHGLGADATQMRPLAQALREQYPQAAVLSLQGAEADERLPGGGAGFQWFSPAGDEADALAEALPTFIAEVRAWAAQFELPWERVALAGFSQGGMLALEAVQAEEKLAGRVLAFGSRYATLPGHAPHEVSVHLFHGMADDVLPYQDVVTAARQLLALGADVTADIRPEIGHELHPELIAKAMEQLRSFIPARLWREAMLAAAEQERK